MVTIMLRAKSPLMLTTYQSEMGRKDVAGITTNRVGGAKRSFLVAAGAKTKRYFPISLYDYCSIIMKTNTIMMMTRSIAVMTIFMRLIQGERKQFLEGGRLQQSVRGHDDRYHHHPRHHHHHHCHDHHYHDHDHEGTGLQQCVRQHLPYGHPDCHHHPHQDIAIIGQSWQVSPF